MKFQIMLDLRKNFRSEVTKHDDGHGFDRLPETAEQKPKNDGWGHDCWTDTPSNSRDTKTTKKELKGNCTL